MPKTKKKNATTKSLQTMDPIEEEAAHQEARLYYRQEVPPDLSDPFDDSPTMFRLQTPTKYEFTNVSATTYPFSSLGPAHRFSQTIYNSAQPEFALQVSEDLNANPIPLMNAQLAHEIAKTKGGVDKTQVIKLDENSSITKLILDTSRLSTIENMFKPYIEKSGELNPEISPSFDGREKRKMNRFDSEVHFLNGGCKDDVRFINVSKNNLCLYKLAYDYYNTDPTIQLCVNRQIPCSYDEIDYSCKCIAVDNSKENRIALGLNSGDIFVTSAPLSENDFNWSTSYHIRMRQNMDSIVALAFDKTTSGTSYLSCAYERGRESEHFISLYDVNKGKDLILDRDVSEKILGMQFLSSDLSVIFLNCMKSVRFVDIREKSFASIMNLNMPMHKIAIEPYNNVQFAGVLSNIVTIFDRRYLSKSLYEFSVGPKSYNITHLEWNPNRYSNITCCSSSSNIMFELDIMPTPKYSDHLSGTDTTDPQVAIITEYVNKFSYGLERINTPLSSVQHFSWCHQKPNIIIAASPCNTFLEPEFIDWTQLKVVVVENDRSTICIQPEGSIIYCDESGFNQITLKPTVTHKNETQAEINEKKNRIANLKSKQLVNPETREELDMVLKRLQIVKSKPTFELEPEEIDMIYEMEQEELKKLNEKIDHDHFEIRPEDTQRQIPFWATKNKNRPFVNKQLQLWFTRSDINQLSITRAKLGYGFATIPGSAKALIENSYYAIKDRMYETDCLKNCWRMLARIYSSNYNETLRIRYGTAFPGVRRMAHNLVTKPSTKDNKEDKIIYRVKYYCGEQRGQILRVVGWTPIDDYDNLAKKLERLIQSPDITSKIRAAAMSVFYLQGYAGKLYLEDILKFFESPDCQYTPTMINEYRLMITTSLEFIEKNDGISIREKELDQLLEKIEDPYLNAMIRFLGRRQYKNYHTLQRQIMAIDSLRLDDRLAIAAIHIDDDTFRSLLEILTHTLQQSHDPLSVLLISGLDDQRYSHLAIHAYLSQTNDIQTAALILCAGNCFRRSKIWETYDMRKPVMERILLAIANNTLKNTRKYSLQIVCSYMEWLQANNLTLQKSYIMTFLRKKIEFPKNDPKIQAGRTQGLIACNFCNKPILPFINDTPENLLLAQSLKMQSSGGRKGMSSAQSLQMAEIERRKMLPKSRGCPHCGRPLPRCLICKRTCIQQRENASKHSQKDGMDEWFIWCTKCAHGGHLNHLRNWFSINQLCPAADCKCPCPKMDNILNANPQEKKKEKELFDDSLLINVNIMSATIESASRSRHSSEQDKMRLIKRLCMSSATSNSALDSLYRRGSNDSGVPVNMGNPLKAICELKANHGYVGSDSNFTTDPIHEEHHQMREISESEHSWNMTPEIVKQSNAMRKILQAQNLKQTLSQLQSHAEPDIIEEEKGSSKRRLLLTSSDNLSVSELSRSHRNHRINFVPKRQSKLNHVQPAFKTLQQPNTDSEPNKWIISGRDKIGRPIATQVKVSIDQPDNEPSNSQTLEQNVRFSQRNILLPAPEHPFASVWSTNPQALQQLVSTEMFKKSVADEKASKDAQNRNAATQLVKEQLAREHKRKEEREHRRQLKEKMNADRNLRKTHEISQTNSSYFSSFDCGSVDIQQISDESDENREDAEEVKKLCEKVDENIRMEKEEIRRLQLQGFRDLNQLAISLKEAEEKKRREVKKTPRHVRIRDTPDILIATPVNDYIDNQGITSKEISPRQRKNSTRNGALTQQKAIEPTTRLKERKSSADRKLFRKSKN